MVRPADQQWRQLEVRFYSMCYIMWSRSGVLSQYKSEKLNQTLYGVNEVLPQKNWKFWYILIFVNILSRFDKSEIGQQLETSSFESFLSIGTTMADLSIDGNTSKKKKLSKGSESQQKM